MDRIFVTHGLRQTRTRTETFMGRSFLVIPAVLVRSQVLTNNLGATLLPADAFTDEWASLWNNIPVIVGAHPSERGQPVSGRSPALLNQRGVGWIFNASVDQENADTRRLIAEVWLDAGRAADVAGLQEVLDRVAAGQPVELSTGFSVSKQEEAGTFHGARYEAVIRPAGADHLVISADMRGACSVTDGCGLGVNEEYKMQAQNDEGDAKAGWKVMMERVGKAIGLFTDKRQTAWDEATAFYLARELEARNGVTPSDQDRANMLRDALQIKFGNQDKTICVCDVYSDNSSVVFFFMTPFGPEPKGSEYFRASFTEANGGFTFGEMERVRRVMSYETVAQQEARAVNEKVKPCGCQEATMQDSEKKDIVNELTTSLTAAFTTMLKPVSDKIDSVVNEARTAAAGVVETAMTSLKTEIATFKTEIGAKVDAATKVANEGREAERSALVKELSTNAKTKVLFTQADLEAKPLDELRKIAELANVEVVNYAGRGAPRTATNAEPESAYAEPVPYYLVAKKKEGE